MKLYQADYEDLAIGWAVTQVTMFVIGIWSIPLGLLGAFLWWAGGRGILGTKAWRRVGIPLTICIPFATNNHLIGASISLVLQLGWQTVGYGTQDINDSEGSWLGRIFKGATRFVWFLIYGLTMIPLCF